MANYEIVRMVKELKIKDFRGVFMRDTLSVKINDIECGILNLDVYKNNGTHWMCYYKNNEECYYCDWDNAQNCELFGVGSWKLNFD